MNGDIGHRLAGRHSGPSSLILRGLLAGVIARAVGGFVFADDGAYQGGRNELDGSAFLEEFMIPQREPRARRDTTWREVLQAKSELEERGLEPDR